MSTTQILDNLGIWSVQIAILTAIAALIPVLLGFKGSSSARVRLWYWQILLVAVMALPWVRPLHSVSLTAAPVAGAPAILLSTVEVTSPALKSSWSTEAIVLAILAAGAAFRVLWLGLGLVRIGIYRRRARQIGLAPEWTALANGADVFISPDISGPVTFGCLRPAVLLPANFEAMEPSARCAILAHELIHVARRDWVFAVGEEMIRAALWFHPAIWWIVGEIRLAREQAVDQQALALTNSPEAYVDALMTVAAMRPVAGFAVAPAFLRRRQLRQRLSGILEEKKMSTKRLLAVGCAAFSAMAMACWLVTGALPLQAQAQVVVDGGGVTVDLAGSQLMHRSSIGYPLDALRSGIEGTVVVQARVDSKGEVIEASILSGPDELRRGVQQSILNWHFEPGGGATHVVNIRFTKPTTPATVTMPRVMSSVSVTEATGASGRGGMLAGMPAILANTPQNAHISAIAVTGLSDAARDRLLAALPVHVGDEWRAGMMPGVVEAAHAVDSHLVVDAQTMTGSTTLRIRPSDSPAVVAPAPSSASANAVRVSPGVVAGNIINQVRPIYPPLAKMARVQGTVMLDAVIGTDGSIENLTVVSGPPLLLPAALDAVKQWKYRPYLLNGVPTEVATSIDVNFSLSDNYSLPPAPVPAQ